MSKDGFTRDMLLQHVNSFKSLVNEISSLRKKIDTSNMDKDLKDELLRMLDVDIIQATESHLDTMDNVVESAMVFVRSAERDG